MNDIRLIEPCAGLLSGIEAYRSEFTPDRERVTFDPERIPGLDYLENYKHASDWLEFTGRMAGKLTWYLSVRKSDGRIVGASVLRHRLEYDDDDPEFSSHIGYSIRPSERGKGYAAAQLGLVLRKAKALGIDCARIVCLDTNIASRRTILANGGRYVDSIHGEESGLTIHRYDIEIPV